MLALAITYMFLVCPLNKNDHEAMNGNMMLTLLAYNVSLLTASSIEQS